MRSNKLFAFIFLTYLAMISTVESSNSITSMGLKFEMGDASMKQEHGWNGGHPGYMGKGSGGRKSYTQVNFETPFTELPIISYGIAYADTEKTANERIYVSIQNITTTGFKVEYKTWADSGIYGCRINWQAIGH